MTRRRPSWAVDIRGDSVTSSWRPFFNHVTLGAGTPVASQRMSTPLCSRPMMNDGDTCVSVGGADDMHTYTRLPYHNDNKGTNNDDNSDDDDLITTIIM